MKYKPMPLLDRLELAAQACHAAHLLSCEATIREAIALLRASSDGTAGQLSASPIEQPSAGGKNG